MNDLDKYYEGIKKPPIVTENAKTLVERIEHSERFCVFCNKRIGVSDNDHENNICVECLEELEWKYESD